MVDRIPSRSQHAAAGLIALLRSHAVGSVRHSTSASIASTSYHTLHAGTYSPSSRPSSLSVDRNIQSHVRTFTSTSSTSVSAHRKQAGREKARLRLLRQEEKLLRRREKDGYASAPTQAPRRPRNPVEEDVETSIREYMARTGPRGERLTRAQQERLLKQELRGLGHQLEKLEKKAKADEATQDLPELDDHTLEELYQALMLPPPPTPEEARLARLEGGRREKSLQGEGRGRTMLAGLLPTKTEERRARVSMDLRQKLIDAREKGMGLLPPSPSRANVRQPPVEQTEAIAEEEVMEEEVDMAALPYAERQEIRLQQLFARLALVQSSADPTTPAAAAAESDKDSLQDIKSNLAQRIAKILQEHDYEMQSATRSNPSDDTPAADESVSPLPHFRDVRLDGKAPALDAVAAEAADNRPCGIAAAESRGDLATRAESMISDLNSAESRTFMLDSIEKLIRSSASPTSATLPLGIATTQEWTALAVSSALAGDTATLSRTISLMRSAGYTAPLELYNDVLDAFATRGEVGTCQELLQQMSELGLAPDDHTYHSLTKAYVNSAQYLPAIQLLNSLESSRPASMATYTLVIDRLASDARPELQALAWNLFYHMRLHAHPVPDAPLYALLIRACASGTPQPHDIDPSSHAGVSDAERALDLFREMTTRYSVRPNAEVYNAVILACARRKDFYLEAFRLLREMVEIETSCGEGTEGGLRFAPDRWTFNALLQGCARNRDLQRARWVLAEMLRSTMPLFDAEVRRAMTRDEVVEVASKRPNEESMCHVFHTYAAYVPPIKRDQLVRQGSDGVETSNTASTAVAPPQPTEVTSAQEDTTPEQAATIFTSLLPQTASDLVAESRSLFARILADQPSQHLEGPLGGVTPGIRLVNAYLTVLAAHLPAVQRAHVLRSALSTVEASRDGAGMEDGLFARLGLEPNEHSYRIVLEALANVGDEAAVEEVWVRFERFMAYPDAASSSAPVLAAMTAIDATQVTKCWSAYLHHLSKLSLDQAIAALRRFVHLYPPPATTSSSNARRDRKKALQRARAHIAASAPTLDLSPLPVPLKSMQSLLGQQGEQGEQGEHEQAAKERPMLSFLDVQLLHHRLVRYGRTKELAYLSWVLHRYSAARRQGRFK